MTCKAIVFDLDDTLYPERQYVHSGFIAVAGYLRRKHGREERFEDWLWQRFLAGERAKALDDLNQQFSLSLSAAEVSELVAVYRNHVPKIHPYEGAADMLSRLCPEFRLGLLTDGFLPAQRLKVEALHVARFFDASVFTEMLGREFWKPSTKGFEMISDSLNVPHEQCAYVADNPAKDFVAPNKLGWRSIQMLRPGQIHAANPPAADGAPQVIVRRWDDLLALLRA